MQDKRTTIQELKNLRHQFITARGWERSRTARNVATSIVIEAAELLEHFQWGEDGDKDEIAKELSDILAYCFDLATELDIDIAAAYRAKTAHAEQKYPLEKFGNGKFDQQEYDRIKAAYRAGKQ